MVCCMTQSKVKVTSAWKLLKRSRPSVPHGTSFFPALGPVEKFWVSDMRLVTQDYLACQMSFLSPASSVKALRKHEAPTLTSVLVLILSSLYAVLTIGALFGILLPLSTRRLHIFQPRTSMLQCYVRIRLLLEHARNYAVCVVSNVIAVDL